jgi:alcohol dehydrogenase class IV
MPTAADVPVDLTLRVALKCGRGTFAQLPETLGRLGYGAPGIVVDGKVLDASPYAKRVVGELRTGFPGHILIEYREPFEPTYRYLDRTAPIVRGPKGPPVDCMIGIGGGSAMDTAKGLATLATNPGPALQFRGFPAGLAPSLPTIAVPTTAGTGSEVIFNAVFEDDEQHKKLGINTTNNFPVLGILDPELVAGAPRSVIVSSGLDALVHTLEGYTSTKATTLSRVFSTEAFRRIMHHLPRLAADRTSLDAALGMQIGAVFAMLGMSNSSSGPSGGLSYYLGTHFGVPHGMAGAVFIGHMMAMNHRLGYHGLADLAACLPGDDGGSEAERSEFVVAAIRGLLEGLNVPGDLTAYGVKPADAPGFHEFATVTLKGAFGLNPAVVPESELRAWLTRMAGGR